MRNIETDFFDEVGCWLRKHNFLKYGDLLKSKGITQLKELPAALKRTDLRKVVIPV